MIFGDIVAVALMQKKNLTLDEFAHNHPAGKIGKNLSLKVEDLMLKGEMLPESKLADKYFMELKKNFQQVSSTNSFYGSWNLN